jgi:cytochrome P450
MSALPNRLTPGNRQFEQALHTLDNVVYRIIDERRRSARDPGDLLAMLLQTRDAETGEGMSDKQVRDEVMTIFIAGHDTVASTLAWTWHLLGQHPQIELQLLDEVDAVLDGQAPTFQDLPRLTYTRMVIEEAMRLYPPAWGLFRSPVVGDMIGGYHIQAGSVVILSPYVLHRTASFWEQPDRFDPERFTPERSAGRPRYAYIPFGGGPRICIGNSLALMELQLIVAMVAQHYRLRSIPGHLVEPYIEVVLQPRNGLRMTLQAR